MVTKFLKLNAKSKICLLVVVILVVIFIATLLSAKKVYSFEGILAYPHFIFIEDEIVYAYKLASYSYGTKIGEIKQNGEVNSFDLIFFFPGEEPTEKQVLIKDDKGYKPLDEGRFYVFRELSFYEKMEVHYRELIYRFFDIGA